MEELRATPPRHGGPSKLSRRIFVRAAGGLVVGAACSQFLACQSDDGDSPEGSTALLDAGAPVDPCRSFLTPVDAFFQQFGGRSTVDGWQLQQLDGDRFRMRIEGLVATPSSLALADLEADQASHVTVLNTMMCVLGFRDSAIWTGIPLRKLLDDAGIDRAAARRVRFFGADGFENNLRVSDIYDSPDEIFEPLVVFRIYGERLPEPLGFPFRLMLADRYGYKNTKWIERIEVTDVDEVTGQYQARGYTDEGVIEPVPTVENRTVSERVPAGEVELCGIALSGRAAVEAVELSLDGGDFRAAQLTPLATHLERHPELAQTLQLGDAARFGWPSRGVWVLWQDHVELTPGEHALELRMRDRAGGIGEATTLRLTAEG